MWEVVHELLVLSDSGVTPPAAGVSANWGTIAVAVNNIWRVGLLE